MQTQPFGSLIELVTMFDTEEKCIKHLESIRWGENAKSPYDPESDVYKCKNNFYKCKNTGKMFNVKTGTIFQGTKLPLSKWFLAMYFISTDNGISSVKLGKKLGITQKRAWHMAHKIRMCLGVEEKTKLKEQVEVDETYIGGKNKNRHKDKKVKYSQGRSYKDKTPIFGMLERNGPLIAMPVKDVKGNTLKSIIYGKVEKGSTVHSDEWFAYKGLSRDYDHNVVYHGKGIYGTEDGSNTNSIEGAWAILKRMISGVHYWVSKKHLQKYIDEFVFRYNNRKSPDYEKFYKISECVIFG